MKKSYAMQQKISLMDLLTTEVSVAMQREDYSKVEELLRKQLREIHEIKRMRNQQQYAVTLREMNRRLNERGIASEVVRKLE